MRDEPDSVMLFAAGLGTRMGGLTADRPKPLIPVAGRPLVDHALEHVRAIRPRRVVANLHYRPEALARHLAGAGVVLSRETPEILDTGGGLRAALPLLEATTVYTMNTDAAWRGPNPLACLRRAWAPDSMEALLLCVPAERAHGHEGDGDFAIAADGRATRGGGSVYCGVQIIATGRLATIGERRFSLNRVWDAMLADGTLFAVPYPGHWADVGHPEGIAAAEKMLGSDHV